MKQALARPFLEDATTAGFFLNVSHAWRRMRLESLQAELTPSQRHCLVDDRRACSGGGGYCLFSTGSASVATWIKTYGACWCSGAVTGVDEEER